jgi:hypothetical protein
VNRRQACRIAVAALPARAWFETRLTALLTATMVVDAA